MVDTVADHPALLKLWDASKNTQKPSEVLTRGFRPAWWRCEKGHSFQRMPRVMLGEGAACPLCKTATSSKSIADTHPTLALLWHPEKNGDLSPSTVDATHAGMCWWRCPNGHDFRRAPLIMIRDASCPTCALAEISLAKVNPPVAAEWNTARNGGVSPAEIDADHIMNAWWICPKGHDYQATVRSRAKGGKPCPICYGGWSLEHIREFVRSLLSHVGHLNPSEKFALAMQAGLLRDKDSRPFVQAFATGRFPVQELEKFARGEPSLVDTFASDPNFKLELSPGPKPEAAPKPDDPYALPAAPPDQDDAVDIDVSREVALAAAGPAAATEPGADPDLPLVKTWTPSRRSTRSSSRTPTRRR